MFYQNLIQTYKSTVQNVRKRFRLYFPISIDLTFGAKWCSGGVQFCNIPINFIDRNGVWKYMVIDSTKSKPIFTNFATLNGGIWSIIRT